MVRFIILVLMTCSLCVTSAYAQFNIRSTPPPDAVFGEPDENGARLVTFTTYSSTAPVVGIVSPDLFPDTNQGLGEKMNQVEQHRFMTILGPIPPGVYRYRYTCDDAGRWRQLRFPDATPVDLRDIPHGVVAGINYYSPYQQSFAQFHIYTPPGYEWNDKAYPVLYILCDRSESSETWGQLSRVNLLLDNLIDAGQAQPMFLVVCPAPEVRFTEDDEFRDEIRRYLERNYRVLPGAEQRAVFGSAIVDRAFKEFGSFGYIANIDAPTTYFPFRDPERELPTWQQHHQHHQRHLNDEERRKKVRLIWFGYPHGDEHAAKADQLALLLTQHHFPVEVYRSNKTNRWQDRRDYLIELLPKLFQPDPEN
ncbi:alpha/beta hydrolase [Blastopirellula retiformator]|uniref:Endo-1,4-beta-xylanase Z n=1 Tax=Blastopirellula retiformator TaxID=2527970 RepID=A0A5C5UWU1_9BACT|nr:hypothetical protein [Blastopirellula retiformator]TWT29845.1 Endo-1,4-beta-xylanase Z precursor [Blastopirellula retiformator]